MSVLFKGILTRISRCKKLTKESNNVKLLIVNKGMGYMGITVFSADKRGDIYMLQECKCGEKKLVTEVDGRFAYQVCGACNSVLNVVYLGPKENTEDEHSILGL
jgi:hypothetical protein